MKNKINYYGIYVKDIIFISIVCGILFGYSISSYPLHTPDAARYSEVGREMLVRHDYLTPYLNGLKYFEKPPLFYWIQAVHIKMFGVSVFAANIANALFAMFSCVLTYLFVHKIFDRKRGLLSAMILASSPLVFYMAHITTLDITLMFFMSASLFSFAAIIARKFALCGDKHDVESDVEENCNFYHILAYTFVGAAVMVKGLIGILFPAAIIAIWILLNNVSWREKINFVKGCFSGVGILLFLLIVLPWHILICIKHPEFFRFYFIDQHFLRYFTNYAGRTQGWWFFPAVVVGGFYPWIFFLYQAIKHCFTDKTLKLFFLIWICFIYCFFSLSKSKLIPYILPIFPPLAIIVADYLVFVGESFCKDKNGLCVSDKYQLGAAISIHLYSIFNFTVAALIFIVVAAKIFFITGDYIVASKNFSKEFSFLRGISISRLSILWFAAVLCVGGVVSSAYFYFCKFYKSVSIILLSTMLLMIISLPMIFDIISKRSTVNIVAFLKNNKKINKNDKIFNIYDYYQDMPYYLGCYVNVVDYQGELVFGANHIDAGEKNTAVSVDRFIHEWVYSSKSHDRKYAVIDKQNLRDIQKLLKYKIDILMVDNDSVLFTNK